MALLRFTDFSYGRDSYVCFVFACALAILCPSGDMAYREKSNTKKNALRNIHFMSIGEYISPYL